MVFSWWSIWHLADMDSRQTVFPTNKLHVVLKIILFSPTWFLWSYYWGTSSNFTIALTVYHSLELCHGSFLKLDLTVSLRREREDKSCEQFVTGRPDAETWSDWHIWQTVCLVIGGLPDATAIKLLCQGWPQAGQAFIQKSVPDQDVLVTSGIILFIQYIVHHKLFLFALLAVCPKQRANSAFAFTQLPFSCHQDPSTSFKHCTMSISPLNTSTN